MANWDHREINKKAKDDCEGTWEKTAELIPETTPSRFKEDISRGTPHVIYDTLAKLREAYLALGFDDDCMFVRDFDDKIRIVVGNVAIGVHVIELEM